MAEYQHIEYELSLEESPIKPVWAFGRPYKRVGRTNQGLSREETQRLVETTRGMTWDALPCAGLAVEDLDRAKVETYLRRAGQDNTTTTETLLENLDLRQGEALMNGAALLFADTPMLDLAVLTLRQRMAVDYVKENGDITTTQYAQLAGLERRQSQKDLIQIVEAGFLIRVGNGPTTHYVLTNNAR